MAQIPQAPIPNAPSVGNIGGEFRPISSAVSDMFNGLINTANRVADASAEEKATQQATADQQASPGVSVATDDSNFPTIYSQAYNRAATLLFTTQKKNDLDVGLNKIYQDNINNPDGYSQAVEKFKGDFLNNVPLFQQGALDRQFTDSATNYQVQVATNALKLTQDGTKATMLDRYANNNNAMYQTIVKLGPDAAAASPAFQGWMADNHVALDALTDAKQPGGPLMSQVERASNERASAMQFREGELQHAFNQVDYKHQGSWVDQLEKTGDEKQILSPQAFEQVIGRLRQNMYYSRAAHTEELQGLRAQASSDMLLMETFGTVPPNAAKTAAALIANGDSASAERYTAMISAVPKISSLRLLPPSQLGGVLESIRSSPNQSETDAIVYRAGVQIQNEQAQMLPKDPIGYSTLAKNGQGQPLVSPAARTLDMSDANSVQARVAGIKTTDATYGTTAPGYRPQEVEGLTQSWASGDTAKKVAIEQQVGQYINQLPPANQAVTWQQMTKLDPSMATHFAMMQDPNTRQAAIDSLSGFDYLKNVKGGDEIITKAQPVLNGMTSTLFPPAADPEGKAALSFKDLAVGVYANSVRRSGNFDTTTFSPIAVQDAVANGLFGYKSWSDMPKINGQVYYPPTKGMDAFHGLNAWSGITDDDLKANNGGNLPVDHAGSLSHAVDAQHVINGGYPVASATPGKYYIGMKGADGQANMLRRQDGSFYIFDLGQHIANFDARPHAPAPEFRAGP